MDYRELIRGEFRNRTIRNPSYSLRAFSRDLGMAQTRLCGVLAGRQGLSEKVATDVASKLKLNEREKTIFVLAVKAKHARSAESRKAAQTELERCKKLPKNKISESQLKILEEWYLPALLNYLSQMQDESIDIKTLSKNWGVNQDSLQSALGLLEKLDLIKLDGPKVLYVQTQLHFESPIPNKLIQEFHKKSLLHASELISQTSIEKRELHTVHLSIDPKDINLLKQRISKFVEDMVHDFHQKKNSDSESYQFNLILAPISIEGEEK